MNVKTLTEIDYFRIRDEAAGFCVSEEGRLSFVHREPFKDSKQIDFYKNAGREWTDYLSSTNKTPVLFWEPVKPLFPIIKTSGACLTLEQLRGLGQFCLSVKNVKECVKLHSEDLKLKVLMSQVELLGDGQEAEKTLDTKPGGSGDYLLQCCGRAGRGPLCGGTGPAADPRRKIYLWGYGGAVPDQYPVPGF